MDPDRIKEILAIAQDVSRIRKLTLEKRPPNLPDNVKITKYPPLKGKGKIAGQNAIDIAVKCIIQRIESILLGVHDLIKEFPLKFSHSAPREALQLTADSWEETGLDVRVTTEGRQPKGKKMLWHLSFEVLVADSSKPLAKACMDIINFRKKKAATIAEGERTFVMAANNIQEAIMENLPDLACGNITQVVMPLYLVKMERPAFGYYNSEKVTIKYVPGQYVRDTSFKDPTAYSLEISTQPLHVLKID
jgi:hypothetical protein